MQRRSRGATENTAFEVDAIQETEADLQLSLLRGALKANLILLLILFLSVATTRHSSQVIAYW